MLKLKTQIFTFLLCTIFTFADDVFAQSQDAGVTVNSTTNGFTFVGSRFSYFFRIENVGPSGQLQFPTDSVVFEVDLPIAATYESVREGSGSMIDGDLNCSLTVTTVTCLSVDNFRLIGGNAFTTVVVEGVVPQVSGPFTLPEPGGDCLVDPDNVVIEANETNNSCGPDVIEVSDPPVIGNTTWMGVTMWDNVMRVYDHDLDEQLNAMPRNMAVGTELHAINDIARNPSDDLLYVFHREYESNTMRLGTIDPATGVTDIGDIGISFHDSAFDQDGTLYAVGRNGILYVVDTDTAIPMALCTTPYGSQNNVHSALAWNTNTDELIAAGSRELRTIDLDNLPVDPADPCPATVQTLQSNLNEGFFAAFFLEGNLFLADDVARFFVAGDNGELLQIGTMPMPMHGLVPDDGSLPSAMPSCSPDAWVFAAPTSSVAVNEVWEVDTATGNLTWVSVLEESTDSIDYELATNSIVLLNAGRGRLKKFDPCTGDLLVEQNVTPPTGAIRSLDIGADSTAFAGRDSSGVLFELDISAGTLTALPGNVDPFGAMAISSDEVIIDVTIEARGDSSITTDELARHSLSAWPDLISTIPLTYGTGFEFNSQRNISSIDINPGNNLLLTMVLRAPEFGAINSSTVLPNVLSMIDTDGNVSKITNVPASFKTAVWYSNALFRSGFERVFTEAN